MTSTCNIKALKLMSIPSIKKRVDLAIFEVTQL
jgi:hypothetical protein